MCLGSRCHHHHHHPCHQMVWVRKDFKGSISFSERQWQFVGTSCPGQQKWRPSSKLSSSFSTHSVSPVLWTMEMKLILHDGKIAFLEGVCPSSLPLFPCPTSHHSSAAACSTLHTGYASPACLFPNLDKCVASWVVSNLLCKLSAEKALAT